MLVVKRLVHQRIVIKHHFPFLAAAARSRDVEVHVRRECSRWDMGRGGWS